MTLQNFLQKQRDVRYYARNVTKLSFCDVTQFRNVGLVLVRSQRDLLLRYHKIIESGNVGKPNPHISFAKPFDTIPKSTSGIRITKMKFLIPTFLAMKLDSMVSKISENVLKDNTKL